MFGIQKLNIKNADMASYIKNNRLIRISGIFSSLVLVIFAIAAICPIVFKDSSAEATAPVPKSSETSIAMVVSKDSARLNITPNSASGTFSSSSSLESAEFNITTNNYTGYTLTIVGNDDNGTLNNTNPAITSNNTLSSITTMTDATTFNTSSALNGKWGYLPSKYNSEANTAFRPSPTTAGSTIDITSAANTTANDYTIALGARVDYSKPAGQYTNTFILTAVGNPVGYSVSYSDNTSDTSVANLPATDSGSTNLTSIKVSNTIPTRTGYTFRSWCTEQTTNNGTTCGGTEYTSGSTLDFIDQTKAISYATLYATWTINTYSFNITFAGEGVSAVKICKVAGDCTGNDLVGTISASGGGVSGLAYGSSYYLYPVFQTSSYAVDNWAKTSTAGTLSSTTDNNPTFTIGNGNGAVTITGKNTKLWFQNASFSDCGKVMYDNRADSAYKDIPYTTAEIDGLCWMTRNLDLPGGTQLTTADSNIENGCGLDNNCTLPASSNEGFSSDSVAYVYNSNNTTCASGTPCYSYYSHRAAIAGTTPIAGIPATSDICPKGWRLPTYRENVSFVNNYTTSDPTAAPFLGVYGGYFGSSFRNGGSHGLYWSSSATVSMMAYGLDVSASGINSYSRQPRSGASVRCVKKQSMQEITTSQCNSNLIPVSDNRDGQKYFITKLDDGNCWMMSNLNLGAMALDADITPENSNINPDITNGKITKEEFATWNRTTSGNDLSYTIPKFSPVEGTDSTTETPYGTLYNYCATSGKDPRACKYSVSTQLDPSYDICPKGWRLPTSAEFQTLYNTLGQDKMHGAVNAGGAAFAFAGSFGVDSPTNQGVNGIYWSSTRYDNITMYDLGLNASSVYPAGGNDRSYGFSIRCVLK